MRYPRTHDLMALVEELFGAGEDTADLDALIDLNPFAVEYRYQSMDLDDDELDRNAALAEIQALFDRVTSKVGPGE
jgi:hypothetical protein